MPTKMSHLLKQTCSWKFEIYLSMFDFLEDTIDTKGLSYMFYIQIQLSNYVLTKYSCMILNHPLDTQRLIEVETASCVYWARPDD